MEAHDVTTAYVSLLAVVVLNLLYRFLVVVVATLVRLISLVCHALAGEPVTNMLHVNDLRCTPHTLDRREVPSDDLESPVDGWIAHRGVYGFNWREP